MKNMLIGLVIAVVIIAGIYYFGGTKPENLIGDNVKLALFATGEKKMGLLYIPFEKTLQKNVKVSVFIDSNNDQIFSDDEKKVDTFPVYPQKEKSNSVPVSFSATPEKGTNIKIVVAGENLSEHEREITEIVEESKDVLELAMVTNPEESMKGFGVRTAFAQESEPVIETFRPGVPDIGQEIAECAPTSAANSIISLINEHGKPDTQVPTPSQMINELKGEMDWTPENGVLPDDFVQGKNKWAAKHGLPIRTEKVGDGAGRGSLQEILDAMGSEEGAAAELRIKFVNAAGTKVTGGHMVTVTGVHIVDGQTFIDVNDPRTPEGTNSYEVVGGVIQDYPYEGQAVVSWGFVQRWEETGTSLEPMTDAEVQGIQSAVGIKEKIKVIEYRGHKIPLSEVHVGKGEHCDGPKTQFAHYHSNSGGKVTALDGVTFSDNEGCGYGKVKDVPVLEVEKP